MWEGHFCQQPGYFFYLLLVEVAAVHMPCPILIHSLGGFSSLLQDYLIDPIPNSMTICKNSCEIKVKRNKSVRKGQSGKERVSCFKFF